MKNSVNKNSPDWLAKKNIIFEEREIKKGIKNLARELNKKYANVSNVVIVGILKGSLIFMHELLLYLDFDFSIDFLLISSYEGKTQPTKQIPFLLFSTEKNLKNQNVILIEDIIESGATLKRAKTEMLTHKCATIFTISLVQKNNPNLFYSYGEKADFYIFPVKKKFLIGYGFDLNEEYRNLHNIYGIKGFNSLFKKIMFFYKNIKCSFLNSSEDNL